MKIIKKNKKHLWIECRHCGSILQPKEKDIRINVDTYRGSLDIEFEPHKKLIQIIKNTTREICCPVCGVYNTKSIDTEEYYISEEDYLSGKWR